MDVNGLLTLFRGLKWLQSLVNRPFPALNGRCAALAARVLVSPRDGEFPDSFGRHEEKADA
jgi:hypothetical protein